MLKKTLEGVVGLVVALLCLTFFCLVFYITCKVPALNFLCTIVEYTVMVVTGLYLVCMLGAWLLNTVLRGK